MHKYHMYLKGPSLFFSHYLHRLYGQPGAFSLFNISTNLPNNGRISKTIKKIILMDKNESNKQIFELLGV